MTLPSTVDTQVLVSWDGTGAFTGTYDDVTNDVASEPGVLIQTGRDGARTLNPPKVSSADFDLLNNDGEYSQERADSPIYQLVLPARPVKVVVEHGTEGDYDEDDDYDTSDYYDGLTSWSLARTAIDDITQTTVLGDQRVSLSTLGIETLLIASNVTVAVMTNPRVDQCVTAILDAVGWPADDREVSVSDTTLLYWWCDDRPPWAALLELLASEGPGAMYVEAGTFHFENRNYRTLTARSTTSQATFFDEDAGFAGAYDEDADYTANDYYDGAVSGLWFTSLSYEPGFQNIYNRATYSTRQRSLASSAEIWTYGTTLTLAASESLTLIARPTNPFQNAITPVSPTDFTVSGGTVSVSLSATSGLVAFITITALTGTPTVSDLQLRAQALTAAGETVVQNNVDTSGSIARFSPIPGEDIPRVLSVQGWPEIDRANAQAVCNAWVNRYQVQRPAVTLTLRNADGEHVYQMLKRAVSDRITVVERNTGLNTDLWINSKTLSIAGAGGRVMTCVLGCEKVEEVSGAAWDEGVWDTGRWGV